MNPEQQRIALAALDGWRILRSIAKHNWIMEHRGITKEIFLWGRGESEPTLLNRINDLPDYLNDLNAIHKVEVEVLQLNITDASLLSYQWTSRCMKYMDELSIITHCDHKKSGLLCIVATAPQRAEAILRTMDLWMEDAAIS
jgi:hypothetical protein